MAPAIKTIRVRLGSRSYDILVGWKILDRLGESIRRIHAGDKALILSDPTVFRLYGRRTALSLTRAGFTTVDKILVPAGEQHKSLSSYAGIVQTIITRKKVGIERFLLVLLGGGVIGDLGGFVAATLYRGLPFVQVPTTLLACVDSGVGGKVGVNFTAGRSLVKNLLGTFYQPKMVFADVSLLRSLPKREILSGLAEVVKYGVIRDASLLTDMETHAREILSLSPSVLGRVVSRSYEIKARVVEQDEREEKGIRTILNFGHTIGHAVEGAAGLHYTHGEAVALGMLCAADFAALLKIFPQSHARRLENIIERLGLPTRIRHAPLPAIMDAMAHDKKFIHGTIRVVLPRRLGRVEVWEGVGEDLFERVIARRMSA